MKPTTLARNGVSMEMVGLISRLVDRLPWPERRCAMGDVTLVLLEGKPRVAEQVLGWNRFAVEVGIKEFQTGISCVNDLSLRLTPKTEEKTPEVLADIHAMMAPHSDAESHLRSTLLYTHMTAKAVSDALVEKGWSAESLPTLRTISNLLNRQDYRLRTVAKTKVQKKPPKPTPSLNMSGR